MTRTSATPGQGEPAAPAQPVSGAGSSTDGPTEEAERERLIAQLEETQAAFERRALSALAEPLSSTSLTMQQFKVLTMIAVDPGRATGQSLATLLQVSLASMSAMVDRLVEHGMVARSEDPHDRRVRRLSVTDAGSDAIRSLLSMAGTMPTPVLHQMAVDDLRALVQGVRALDRAAQRGAVPES